MCAIISRQNCKSILGGIKMLLNVMASLSALEIVGGIIVLIAAIALIAIIILQSGSTAGLGTIDGGADSFLSKNKARSVDAKLRGMTKWIAIVFAVFILLLNVIAVYLS